MHIHILGICGTFMGGIAADRPRGRPPRHRVRRQRLSADEHPARSAGHRAHRGLRRRPDRARAGPVRHRQRGDARQSADGGDSRPRAALRLRVRSGSPRTCCAGSWVLARRRHPRQDDDRVDARVDPRACGIASGLPDRRRAARTSASRLGLAREGTRPSS